jgi:hypothetical protein
MFKHVTFKSECQCTTNHGQVKITGDIRISSLVNAEKMAVETLAEF